MGQWQSQTRKMNKHYQSTVQGAPLWGYLDHDFELSTITVNGTRYITPLKLEFENDNFISNYGIFNLDFNSLTPISITHKIREEDGKHIFKGVYLIDEGVMKAPAFEFFDNENYYDGYYYSSSSALYETFPDGENEWRKDNILIPSVKRILVMYAWITDEAYNNEEYFPEWIKSIPETGAYTGMFDGEADAPYIPMGRFSGINPYTSNTAKYALTEAALMVPDIFTSKVQVPKSLIAEGYQFGTARTKEGGDTTTIPYYINGGNTMLVGDTPYNATTASDMYGNGNSYAIVDGTARTFTGGTIGKTWSTQSKLSPVMLKAGDSGYLNSYVGTLNECFKSSIDTDNLTFKFNNWTRYVPNFTVKTLPDTQASDPYGCIYFTVENRITKINIANNFLFGIRKE